MSEKRIVPVDKAEHLKHLNELTRQIIGESCWNAHLGYGDELKLDIGAKIPNKIREHGAWQLGSRGTNWKLADPRGNLLTGDYEDIDDRLSSEIEMIIQVIVGTQVVTFDVEYPSLSLIVGFSNGCELSITPTSKDDQWDLPYWELFSPNGLIEFGPHAQYSFYSKNS